MTSNRNTRCFIATLLLAFSLTSSYTQVIWAETFSDPDAATTEWQNGGTNEGTQTWSWHNDPSEAYAPQPFAAPSASDGYFMFDSEINGYNAHNVTLTGPTLNCSASVNTRVSFWAQYMYFSAPNAELQVSVDGGDTWTGHTLFENLWPEQLFNGNVTINIPEADSQSNVRLRFVWAGYHEYMWKIDDIFLFNTDVVAPMACQQDPNAVICDNMDVYSTTIKLGVQANWWTTWFGAEGDVNDGTVSTEQFSTPPNALKIVSTSPFGGLESSILQMGNLQTGRYALEFKVYVPAGKSAYYDLRSAIPIVFGGNNFSVYFDTTGIGHVLDQSEVEVGVFSFTPGSWITLHHTFDLDENKQTFRVDDNPVKELPYPGDLGGVLFMGYDAAGTFYVDDVSFMKIDPAAYTVDDCQGAVSLTDYFGGPIGVPQTTGLYNNTTATAHPNDPAAPDCFTDGQPGGASTINGSMWFTFTGDGGKYHIETVPCDATDYIDNGDTQMALFTGECGNFSPVQCSDDMGNVDDYRAGFDIETTMGTNYYVMVDGWSDPLLSYVATGEFCIQVTRQNNISCAQGAVGNYMIYEGYVCAGAPTGSLFSLYTDGFVLPTTGPAHGIAWAVTTEPVPAGVWPPSMNSYWGSFTLNSDLYTPDLVNNGTVLTQDSLWYFTPVVVANAIPVNGNGPAYLHELDITEACYFVGESAAVFFLDELAPLSATYEITAPTAGNNDGAIDLTVAGGLLDIMQIPANTYSVEWTGPNGFIAEKEDLDNLSPGTYTAVITDMTECIEPIEVTIQLEATAGAKDPAGVKSLLLAPNPTAGATLLDLQLAAASGVRVEVMNAFGQTLQVYTPDKSESLKMEVDMSAYASGTYFVRVGIDGESAVRRVVVNR